MFQGLVCDTNIFRMYVIFSEQHAAGYGCLSKFTHDICVSEKMIGNYAKNFKKTFVEETLLKHCSRIKAVFSARPHSCFFANVTLQRFLIANCLSRTFQNKKWANLSISIIRPTRQVFLGRKNVRNNCQLRIVPKNLY